MTSPTSSTSLFASLVGYARQRKGSTGTATPAPTPDAAPQAAEVGAPASPTASEPLAEARQLSLSTETEQLCSVAVITGSSVIAESLLFGGVVGEIKNSGLINETFLANPAYADISYAFQLDPEIGVGEGGAQYEVIPMLKSDVPAFLANMIRGSRASWDALYAASGNNRQLAAERKRTMDGVDNFLATQALTDFNISVSVGAHVSTPTALPVDRTTFRTTEEDLANEADIAHASMRVDLAREVLPTPEFIPASPPLREELRNHPGEISLELDGVVQILAADADQALRVMMNVMSISKRNMSTVRNVLTFQVGSIQNANLMPSCFDDPDGDDDGYEDDGRERG